MQFTKQKKLEVEAENYRQLREILKDNQSSYLSTTVELLEVSSTKSHNNPIMTIKNAKDYYFTLTRYIDTRNDEVFHVTKLTLLFDVNCYSKISDHSFQKRLICEKLNTVLQGYFGFIEDFLYVSKNETEVSFIILPVDKKLHISDPLTELLIKEAKATSCLLNNSTYREICRKLLKFLEDGSYNEVMNLSNDLQKAFAIDYLNKKNIPFKADTAWDVILKDIEPITKSGEKREQEAISVVNGILHSIHKLRCLGSHSYNGDSNFKKRDVDLIFCCTIMIIRFVLESEQIIVC